MTLVNTAVGRTWLGGIASEDHYLTLVQWARDVAEHGHDHALPESLLALQFQPA